MLAAIQRIVVLSIALLLLAWASVCFWFGFAAWGVAGVLGVPVLFGGILAAEFAYLRGSFESGDLIRPSAWQLVSAWIREVAATPRIFLWQQPFRSKSEPDSLRSASATSANRGIVLVHGFFCNRGIWNRWMRHLLSRGVPFAAVDLEPVFGSIDDYLPAIARAADEITAATGRPPLLVAHSMGGLAVRAWLARTGLASRCHAVVTIGTPHRGTEMARRSGAINGRQMRIGSEWLAKLEASERSLPPARFVCFWSHCDNIVFPSRNATLDGADNRHLAATPHVQMIHHPDVMSAVLHLVGEPAAA